MFTRIPCLQKLRKDKKMPNEIRGFRGEHYFLSNFYPCRLEYGNLVFQCVESAFQAMKCANWADSIQFQQYTGAEAKKMGRQVKLRDDWEELKLSNLARLVRLKFTSDLTLLGRLLATGDAVLVEENHWHDNFYGDCVCERCKTIPGQNWLGRILMELREELKRELGLADTEKPQITIVVSGGMVQDVYTTSKMDMEVEILDFDDNGAMSDEERDELDAQLERVVAEHHHIY